VTSLTERAKKTLEDFREGMDRAKQERDLTMVMAITIMTFTEAYEILEELAKIGEQDERNPK